MWIYEKSATVYQVKRCDGFDRDGIKTSVLREFSDRGAAFGWLMRVHYGIERA